MNHRHFERFRVQEVLDMWDIDVDSGEESEKPTELDDSDPDTDTTGSSSEEDEGRKIFCLLRPKQRTLLYCVNNIPKLTVMSLCISEMNVG